MRPEVRRPVCSGTSPGLQFPGSQGRSDQTQGGPKPMAMFKQRIRQLTRRLGVPQHAANGAVTASSLPVGWKAYFGLAQPPRLTLIPK
jgi:hypothetical protein